MFVQCSVIGCDPFNQNSNRSDREKWSTSKGGPVFSKRLDQTDPLSFGPKFPEILVEWIAPNFFFCPTQLNQSYANINYRWGAGGGGLSGKEREFSVNSIVGTELSFFAQEHINADDVITFLSVSHE